MLTATMTSKGQITIPVKIREALGLKPGVRIDFYQTEDGKVTLRPKTGSIMDMKGCLDYDGPPISIEEMNRGIGEHVSNMDLATKSAAPKSRANGETA
jgi:antitoxin PrlF